MSTTLSTEAKRDGVHLSNKTGDLVGKIIYDYVAESANGGRYQVEFELPYSDYAGPVLTWKTLEAAEFYALAIVADTHEEIRLGL